MARAFLKTDSRSFSRTTGKFYNDDMKMYALLLIILATALSNCFGQGIMPPTNAVSRLMISNTVMVDGLPMTLAASNRACVNVDGIVGYTTLPGSTNPVVVKADSRVTQAGNATLIADPFGQEHLQLWRDANWLSSTDLVNWQTNINFVGAVYDLPWEPQQFFRFPAP